MAKFKFMVIYLVDAKNEYQARIDFAKATENDALEDLFETLVVKPALEQPKGLKGHLRSQFGFRRK